MDSDSTPERQVAVLAVVLAVVLVPLSGVVVAQTAGNQTREAGNQTATSFVAVQGQQCTPMTAFAGNESARTFYDYRLPFPNNPYINTTGNAYGSEGLDGLQRANTSVVFLYRDTNGTANESDDTLSLVFVHGEEGDDNSTGGSASFDITGLPENGSWTVRDDDYNASDSYDVWTVEPGTTRVDWTWGDAATDGGVFSGLGANETITVQPAFNEDAVLAGQYYDGTVTGWVALSNETVNGTSVTNETALNMTEPLTITTEDCASLVDATPTETETPGGLFGDETETPTETETTSPTDTPEADDDGTETPVDIFDDETATPENESTAESD
ncbi:hypothetical protein EGH21_14160 [Halomicroarcula sp. F13]|uniref:Cell surface glycoprotein related protein n=1 Tax=Haloarcula rubra TaxID=2487747 RepID=A0AAW4PUY7_9EURY|nr:hypothetical protein [Halomicroarcula rubra]MBX0324178.1 hypothetical protein [Halomicroarcula rubra]